jgi:putative membrane protein
MRWILAFHIVFMVAWFAGVFYLPRLFVYHADSSDEISNKRFQIMEKRLFYGIMTPTGIITTILGLCLLFSNLDWYITQGWMQAKLALVLLLWIYHFYCWRLLRNFQQGKNKFSAKFYRWFNEVSIILLIAIVILVVVKP